MDCDTPEGPLTAENCVYFPTDLCRNVGQTKLTIHILPDDALLYIFDFYVAQASKVEAWHALVHVCRRWRRLVFESPRRLKLRIVCTARTPVRKMDIIWPPLPIVISGDLTQRRRSNIRAALGHHDRVCQIELNCKTKPRLEATLMRNLITKLEKPFPILTDIHLYNDWSYEPFDPDPAKFLGGRSAHLRSLTLRGILEIPDLPKLLLTTPNLVTLRLENIDPISYRPDKMVSVLSALTSLERLELRVSYNNPRSPPENRSLPLLMRTVFPSLAILKIEGETGYLEDYMARTDAPLLDHMAIRIIFTFFNPNIVLDTPQLLRFISRSVQQPPKQAFIRFYTYNFEIEFAFSSSFHTLKFGIFCGEPERQFPCLSQSFRSAPFPTHPLDLFIEDKGPFSEQGQQNHTENTRWLVLLRKFCGVINLYLAKEIAIHIAHALQELVGERVMEVLPILENVFIDEFQPSGPVHEVIKEFVDARRLAGRLITISGWNKNADKDVNN